MIKRLIQHEDITIITIVNVHTPNVGVPDFMNQSLLHLKREKIHRQF